VETRDLSAELSSRGAKVAPLAPDYWHLWHRLARNVLYRDLIEALHNNTPMGGLLELLTVHPKAVSRSTKMVSRKTRDTGLPCLRLRASTPSTLTTKCELYPSLP